MYTYPTVHGHQLDIHKINATMSKNLQKFTVKMGLFDITQHTNTHQLSQITTHSTNVHRK